jgi:hypothetical protein
MRPRCRSSTMLFGRSATNSGRNTCWPTIRHSARRTRSFAAFRSGLRGRPTPLLTTCGIGLATTQPSRIFRGSGQRSVASAREERVSPRELLTARDAKRSRKRAICGPSDGRRGRPPLRPRARQHPSHRGRRQLRRQSGSDGLIDKDGGWFGIVRT